MSRPTSYRSLLHSVKNHDLNRVRTALKESQIDPSRFNNRMLILASYYRKDLISPEMIRLLLSDDRVFSYYQKYLSPALQAPSELTQEERNRRIREAFRQCIKA